jgi:hypothetical protein
MKDRLRRADLMGAWSQRQNSGAFLGENLNPQVKKRLAAVIGMPGSCVRGRTGAVFLRRFSDGVNFYEVYH